MAERKPVWVDGVQASEARLANAVFLQGEGSGDALDALRVRAGVRPAGANPGQVTVSTNSVTVQPFQAVVAERENPTAGPYLVTLEAVQTLPLPAAHPSLARTDLVAAEVADDGFVVKLYVGEPLTNPVPPVPSTKTFLPLAQISVKPGQQPAVTDLRKFTAAAGGILPVRTAAELPTAAQASPGQFAYRLDSGELQVFRAGGWQRFKQPRNQWQPLPLSSGWTPYTAGGVDYHPPGWLVGEDGWVHLRGMLKRPDNISATSIQIAALPPAGSGTPVSVPAAQTVLIAMGGGAAFRVEVSTGGKVVLYSSTASPVTYPSWLSLDGLSFPNSTIFD